MLVSVLLAASLHASPALVAPPLRCAPQRGVMTSSPDPALLLRPQDRRGQEGAQTLESLPPASLQLTVERSVQGCPVSTVVRENVQGDGRFARPR